MIKGAIFTEEHKRNLSAACKGRILSAEHKQKISDANKGRPYYGGGAKKGKKTGRIPKSAFKKGYKPWNKDTGKLPNCRGYGEFWHKIRRMVYKRDGNRCRECGTFGKMCAHHIDYNIENNDLSNLITLCVSCHVKTNFNREDWIKHYKEGF